MAVKKISEFRTCVSHMFTNRFFLFFQYEILFCVQDADDPRLRMYVEGLRAKFPNVDCSVRIPVVFFAEYYGSFTFGNP